MGPLYFEPVYQNYVWGGTRIPTLFHRPKPQGDRFAESWEISDRKEGMSVVANGPLKGMSLAALLAKRGKELLGRNLPQFPLLVKLIDARENLSVQVHPNEETAPLLKGEPKTEMWVALDQSRIYAGFKKKMSPEAFEEAIQKKQIAAYLKSFDLQQGDAMLIPGGRVHAICEGSLLLEIQQSSNTTYRLYDWGRKGRQLHLNEGFASIEWEDIDPALAVPKLLKSDAHHRRELLVRSPFFTTERVEVFDRWIVPRIPKTFQILFCSKGKGLLCAKDGQEPFATGMTYLLPASLEQVELAGRCQAIRVYLP